MTTFRSALAALAAAAVLMASGVGHAAKHPDWREAAKPANGSAVHSVDRSDTPALRYDRRIDGINLNYDPNPSRAIG